MNKQKAENSIILHIDKATEKISRHIYGHFAEHLGRCIYDGFYVGDQNPKVPNTNGLRDDIITALKRLNIPNLRWPGGCFADTYHWKDGVGPKHKRPTIVNRWWGNVTEDNSFGTHDFLELCTLLGAEPYISVNVGSGTVQEVADWVQYVNFEGISPMSELRKEHGRESPWQVKFWGIGNEAWGCGGNMSASYYANIYRQYVTFMSGWSNTEKLFRIASGANSGDYQWTEILMRDIPHHLIEGIALHHYAVMDWNNKGPSTGFSETQYHNTMKATWRMDEIITRHSTIMDAVDPLKKIALVVDEWGGWYDVEPGTNPGFLHQQNTMRDAVLAATTLNIFNAHCGRVRMANLAQTVNVLQAVILTHDEHMWVTPTYHVMEMYKVHQDATNIPLEITTNEYLFNNESVPAVSVSASLNQDGIIHLTLANIHASEHQEITIDLKDKKFETTHSRILTAKSFNDHNTLEYPDKVAPVIFDKINKTDNILNMKLPPFSICVIALQ